MLGELIESVLEGVLEVIFGPVLEVGRELRLRYQALLFVFTALTCGALFIGFITFFPELRSDAGYLEGPLARFGAFLVFVVVAIVVWGVVGRIYLMLLKLWVPAGNLRR